MIIPAAEADAIYPLLNETSLTQALIRFISGSTSGSAATVAATRRSKYWISIRVPSGGSRQPGVGHRRTDGVAESRAGDVADWLVAEEDGLVSHHH